jgi:L-ribulose-5-phosphate 4-epimerase
MLDKLKTVVCKANLDLVAEGLVLQTWGNVSGIDRERGLMVIKPSGVPYASMKPQHMVVVSLADGNVVEGNLRPSSDTPTHLVLYQAFPAIGGVVHTHSLYATAWAQACKTLPSYGTTQADYWYGDVPCTRKMKPAEIKKGYEANTGKVIVETFKEMKFNPAQHPAVLVASHGPFTWGKDAQDAVHNAVVLEFIARLASETLRINPKTPPMQSVLLDKHFLRKHGASAYYGQK